jgi:hypothetical protein
MSLDSWMHETGPAAEAATARFLSQVEEEEKATEPVKEPIPIRKPAPAVVEDPFFETHEPVAEEPLIAGPVFAEEVAATAPVEHEPVFSPAMTNGNGFHHAELEAEFEPEQELPKPKFAELAEEPAYTLLPKEYAAGGFGKGAHAAVAIDERTTQPATLFQDSEGDGERDLDVPAFMRRLQF